MPQTILGAETSVISGSGIEGDRTGRAEVAFLDALRAPDEAYVWAISSPLDEPVGVLVQAFQVCGAQQELVLDAFVTSFREPTIDLNLGEPVAIRGADVDGLDVLTFTGQDGVLYLYASRDTVFAVWAPAHEIATDVTQELVSR